MCCGRDVREAVGDAMMHLPSARVRGAVGGWMGGWTALPVANLNSLV